MHLLHAADVVQLHDSDVVRVVEVAHRRVDKRQVPVLPDTQRDHRRFGLRQQVRVPDTLRLGVGRITAQFVKSGDAYAVDQMLTNVAPEGSRVVRRNPHVLI